MADTISALEWSAITILVRRSAIGNIDRPAWRFRHSAPLTFGFQNSGEFKSIQIATRQQVPLPDNSVDLLRAPYIVEGIQGE
jgi:hypothetical protein